MGALLFWPGLAALIMGWKKSRSPLLLLATALWTSQGFFQITRRLDVLMSV